MPVYDAEAMNAYGFRWQVVSLLEAELIGNCLNCKQPVRIKAKRVIGFPLRFRFLPWIPGDLPKKPRTCQSAVNGGKGCGAIYSGLRAVPI